MANRAWAQVGSAGAEDAKDDVLPAEPGDDECVFPEELEAQEVGSLKLVGDDPAPP